MLRIPRRRIGCNDQKFHARMSAKLKGFTSFCDNKHISGWSDFFTDVNTEQSEHWNPAEMFRLWQPRARTENREFLTCCETTSQEETSSKWILKQDSRPFSCVIYLLNPPGSTCRVWQRGNQIRLQGRSVREMKNELVTSKKTANKVKNKLLRIQ